MRAFICDYKEYVNSHTKQVVLLLENTIKNPNGGLELQYKRMVVTDQEVAAHPVISKILVNVKADTNRLITNGGSFERFLSFGKKTKTAGLIILTEIQNEDGKCLGYRIANSKGEVKREKIQSVLNYCKEVYKDGGVVFQNAMYVTDGNFIRSYTGQPFFVETVKTKNKYSQPAEIQKEEVPYSNKDKLLSMFTKEQITELALAKKSGVDIRIIGNNKLSPKQMNIIWKAESNGYPARQFAEPEYSTDIMEYLVSELETGSNISQMLNPKYDIEQLFQISLGELAGVDVSDYGNPIHSALTMARRRADLESNTWGSCRICEGSLENITN